MNNKNLPSYPNKNKVFGCDALNTRNEYPLTELNENDRKILDKYTKFYTNQIESNFENGNIFENVKIARKG
jgi:hypothetical protein